jgi:hypothetical protein
MKITHILIVTILFVIVGSMDMKDAESSQNNYCDMVKAGHWPNYNKAINCQ